MQKGNSAEHPTYFGTAPVPLLRKRRRSRAQKIRCILIALAFSVEVGTALTSGWLAAEHHLANPIIAGFFPVPTAFLRHQNHNAPSQKVPVETRSPLARTSPSTEGPALIAEDSFMRSTGELWGVSSGGRTWNGDANSSNAFSIQAGFGLISSREAS